MDFRRESIVSPKSVRTQGRKTAARQIPVLLLMLLLLLLSAVNASAEAEKTVSFESRKLKIDWSWDYFDKDAETIKDKPNLNLAIAGLILSGNAERDNPDAAKKTLETLGFTSIESDGYKNNSIFYPAMVFGLRRNVRIDDKSKTVVCAVFRGTKSFWDNITNIASQTEGFSVPGLNCYNRLKKYLNSHHLKREDVVLFITGHSYGAAVGSQVAQYYKAKWQRKSTFTYLYATPNNLLRNKKIKFNNVINYVNIDDGVPKVPIGSTYGKIGTTKEYDYGKQLNQDHNRSQQAQFDLAYRFLRDKYFAYDKSLFRDHCTYTYLSFLLSEMPAEKIIHMFDGEPRVSAPSVGENGKVSLYLRYNSLAKGAEVYYSTKENGAYKPYCTTNRKSGDSILISDLKSGKTYYFKVRTFYRPACLLSITPIRGVRVLKQTVYSDKSEPIKVTIRKKVSISLNKSSLTLYTGQKAKLTASKKGTTASIKWRSTKPKIVTVDKKGNLSAKNAGTAVITASVNGRQALCRVTVKKKTKKELSGYYRKPCSEVRKKFPGGIYVKQYAEYDQYRYKNAVTFFFPKPVAVQAKSPASILLLNGKSTRFSLFGITVGMKKETAFKKLQKAGFKRNGSYGNYYYWKGSNYRQVDLEVDDKVKSIRYGAW